MLFVALHLRAATYSVRLAWDPNSEPDIAGYKVYWGEQSGAPNQSRNVGNVTAATLTISTRERPTFSRLPRSTTAGLESGPSNEVSHTTPSPPPQVYRLTVVRGSGSGPYSPGTSVQVHADPPGRGEEFEYWDDDTAILQRLRTDKDNEAFTIERDVTITAVYSALPSFTVTVINGTGDGTSSRVKRFASSRTLARATSNLPAGVEMPSSRIDYRGRRPSQCPPLMSGHGELLVAQSILLSVTNGTGSGKLSGRDADDNRCQCCPSRPTVCRLERKR